MKRYTITQFNLDFPNDDACLDVVKNLIYPTGITCRKCGVVRPHHRLTKRKAYSCDYCGTHVYPLAATIFEKSRSSLKSWFYAMYLMASTRTGISAKQLERELGCTYKTAWRFFKQIRKLMSEVPEEPLPGDYELDETFWGGASKNRHRSKRNKEQGMGRGPTGKTPIFGILQRGGYVTTYVIPKADTATIEPYIKRHIAPGSRISTDEAYHYRNLRMLGYSHGVVRHSAEVYVDGEITTNRIEGLWSTIKRGMSGVNHYVSPKYLQGYVDAYSFRYNHRDDATPMHRILTAMIRQVRDGKHGEYAPID